VDLVSQNPQDFGITKMGPSSSKIGENMTGTDFGRNWLVKLLLGVS